MSADKAFEEWKKESGLTAALPRGSVAEHHCKAAWLASRKAALEEAAKACQSHEPKDFTTAGIITRAKCAQAILALTNKEA